MTRRLLVYSGITLFVVLLFLILVRPLLEARLTIVDYTVPPGYSGWLVVAWGCEGGSDFDDLQTDGNHHGVAFDDTGVACIASDPPSPGYGIGGYRYPDGSDAPVAIGGTINATAYYAATPVAGGVPAVSPTGHVYGVASIGIGTAESLGDRCDLETFLGERFGEPRSSQPCGPIDNQVEFVPVEE